MYSAYAMTSILNQFNLDSDLAINGEQAVRLVKQRYENNKTTYQLIIMDYYLPLCDGLEASYQIRQYFKEQGKDDYTKLERPYICLLTSNTNIKCK